MSGEDMSKVMDVLESTKVNGHNVDPCTEDFLDSATVSLIDNAATPISAEFEYLYACGLPYELLDPEGPGKYSRSRKCLKTSALLRRRIAGKKLARRLHKYENYERHKDLDNNVGVQYNSLLNIQCGPSHFSTEPDASWVKIGHDTYVEDSTGIIYHRRKTTQEFCIKFPKISVLVEYVSDEMVKSIIEKPKVESVVPTLDNAAFRHVYEQAVKNVEKEKETETQKVLEPAPVVVERLPITGFIEETIIEKAIRQAKAKPKKTAIDAIRKQNGTRMKTPNGSVSRMRETPIQKKQIRVPPAPPSARLPPKVYNMTITTPVVPSPRPGPLPSLWPHRPLQAVPPKLDGWLGQSCNLSDDDDDEELNIPPHTPSPMLAPSTDYSCALSDDGDDILAPATGVPSIRDSLEEYPTQNGKTFDLDNDDADILNIDIDDDMDWLSVLGN